MFMEKKRKNDHSKSGHWTLGTRYRISRKTEVYY